MQFSQDNKIQNFRASVIEWYKQYGDKHLPWRNTRNPWLILCAAFLLRKTTTQQVVKIYNTFIKLYPEPKAVLSSDENEIAKILRPLGIEYHRSKLLKKLALDIMRLYDGNLPCSKEKLKKLPGIGEYIASEILLLACDQPEPLLDRNMIRVLERVFSLKSNKKRPHTDPEVWAFAKKIVPNKPIEAKMFNYGVLDLGRKVCKVRNPQCTKCPLKSICDYYKKS